MVSAEHKNTSWNTLYYIHIVYDTLIEYANNLLWSIGVIWHALQELLPGSTEAINYLKRQGKKVIYVTNNSILPIQMQLKKFENFGIEVKQVIRQCVRQSAGINLKKLPFLFLESLGTAWDCASSADNLWSLEIDTIWRSYLLSYFRCV